MHLAESPVFPPGRPRSFRATVHGTVFADRERLLDGICAGDPLTLATDPLESEESAVWVHVQAGDPVGHLPPEIGSWLAPWIRSGGSTTAVAIRVKGPETPSWRRLLVEVRCP
jgi:hypothetical protein